jgi:hypothetical protein
LESSKLDLRGFGGEAILLGFYPSTVCLDSESCGDAEELASSINSVKFLFLDPKINLQRSGRGAPTN